MSNAWECVFNRQLLNNCLIFSLQATSGIFSTTGFFDQNYDTPVSQECWNISTLYCFLFVLKRSTACYIFLMSHSHQEKLIWHTDVHPYYIYITEPYLTNHKQLANKVAGIFLSVSGTAISGTRPFVCILPKFFQQLFCRPQGECIWIMSWMLFKSKIRKPERRLL